MANSQDEWLVRSWTQRDSAAADTTLVIAFAGLAGRLGDAGGRRVGDRHQVDGHAGLPPHEFVNACKRAGATHVIFCRDSQQAWYLRGKGGFDVIVAALREDIEALRPARVLTLGSSMGGYAAIRAGLALGVWRVVAFAPQALIDSTARTEADLPTMPFDELLRHLKRVLWMEGVKMTSLVESVSNCAPDACTSIEIHVGGNEAGDIREAEMVNAAVDARGNEGLVSCQVHIHRGQDHGLVRAMRDTGELHELLVRLVGSTSQ